VNRNIAIIWIGTLLATVLGIVPAVVALLQRALRAALNIERYTAEMLQGGVGIAGNTASTTALKDTIGAAPLLVGGADALEKTTARLEAVLANRSLETDAADSQSQPPAPAQE
jgi:apolipoprotein N-acyltransferase